MDYEERKKIIESYKRGLRDFSSFSHKITLDRSENLEDKNEPSDEKAISGRFDKIYAMTVAALAISILSLIFAVMAYLKA